MERWVFLAALLMAFPEKVWTRERDLSSLEGLFGFTSISRGSAGPSYEPCRRLERKDLDRMRSQGFECLDTGHGESSRAQYSCHRVNGGTFTEIWIFRTDKICADAVREMATGG